MYHCHIQFYLTGCGRGIFELLESVPPLEHFTHTFTVGEGPQSGLAAQADVILAGLQGEGDTVETVRALAESRKAGSELIVLADREQAEALVESALDITDIWPVPLSDAELRFRFRKWQRDYKRGKDGWQANNFLEACINGSPDLVWFKNKSGIHTKVNDSFCEVVGKTKAQVEGHGHAYIWDGEQDDPADIALEEEVMRRGETRMAEEMIQTDNGEKLLNTYKSPLYDLDSSVMGTVGVAIDVTKERHYEQELLEKSRTLEILFSTIDCGMMCHSIDGQEIFSINQAALRLLGYESKEEMIADGFDLVTQSVVEEDRAMLRQRITSLQQVGDCASAEYRVRHKDGKLLYILGNVKLVEDNGQLFYQRFLLDYTAQKMQEVAKQAQKDQEIQYQERIFEIFSNFLSENIDDIYMMLNGEGDRIEFVSRNIERVLGMSPEHTENLLGQLGKVRYSSGKRVTRQDLIALQPGMGLEPRETERIHLITGEHRWFRESVYCVSVQKQRKIIIYIADRTQERKAQNALSEALDMAQVANRAKTAFLGNVSHDIRTPLNAILGMVTLLQEEAGNPERVMEYTQKISAASQHLLGLINDVLDMNKIESGSAVLNIDTLNLAEVIDELNDIIQLQASAKNQTFEIFTPSLTYEYLLGDKLRITQIFLNILSNAVKYTPPGGRIQMWVAELPQVDPNYSRIRFTVTDNGQGMSKEYLKVIFDPFTRELNTGINEIQGTGLGMAITKSLVDLMNGTIQVTSKPGKGSTFVVELELRIQNQEDDSAFWRELGITRMLVTDDEEDICRDVVRKMAGTGVEASYALSGQQALEMVRTAQKAGKPYDLILMDWKMPEISGLEATRLLREECPDGPPVLLFTSCSWSDIKEQAQEAGVCHFLPKPFFMGNFKDTVRKMLAPRSADSVSCGEDVIAGKRIMVVDDIEVNRMILVKILTSLGASCEAAKNGREAAEKFACSQPGEYDIILMDIQMPVMDGHTATRTIRSSGRSDAQSIAIIAMTANAFVEDIRIALEAGMDAHISKPIVVDQVKSTIKEVLERKKQTAN